MVSNFEWLLKLNQIRGRNKQLITWQGPDLFVYTSSGAFFLDAVREKSSYISVPILHFICMWPRTFSSWLEHIKNFLVYCRNQQKVRKYMILTKINMFMTWVHKEFALICVVEFNRKYMKLTNFGMWVNKTTYLFLSIRDRNISRDTIYMHQGQSFTLKT